MSNQIIIIATDSATEFKIAKSLNNTDTKIYLWNSFCEEEDIKSIIKEIEKKSDEYKIRENYTSWIYELTTIKNNNKTIIDSLRLESGFSFWWTTLIIEQSLTKQPSINDVLKLIFIETISKEYKPKSIKFIGKSYTISSVINNFCNNLGISFIQTNSTKKSYFKLLSKL